MTSILVLAWRYRPPVDSDRFDLIGIVDAFQCRSGMPFLPAGFALVWFGFQLRSALTVRVLLTAECCCWNCSDPISPQADGRSSPATRTSPALRERWTDLFRASPRLWRESE